MHRDKWLILLAGTAIAGGTYYWYTKSSSTEDREVPAEEEPAPLKPKVDVEFALEQHQVEWLEEMSVKYSLPDADKALRICLTYANSPEQEKLIYSKIKNAITKHRPIRRRSLSIDVKHERFLDGAVGTHHLLDVSKAAQMAIDHCMTEVDEETLFGVVRCAHGDVCNSCSK